LHVTEATDSAEDGSVEKCPLSSPLYYRWTQNKQSIIWVPQGQITCF